MSFQTITMSHQEIMVRLIMDRSWSDYTLNPDHCYLAVFSDTVCLGIQNGARCRKSIDFFLFCFVDISSISSSMTQYPENYAQCSFSLPMHVISPFLADIGCLILALGVTKRFPLMTIATCHPLLPVYKFQEEDKVQKISLKSEEWKKLRAHDAAQQDQLCHGGLEKVVSQEITSQQFILLSG